MKFFYRNCGLVVRVSAYRSRGPGSIPGTTKVYRSSDRLFLVKLVPTFADRGCRAPQENMSSQKVCTEWECTFI
jgi:hypothetical protein